MVTEPAERLDGQILKGLLDTLVLTVLAKEDNYGFGILQRIGELLGEEGALLQDATLYPLLHRLESKGYLASYFRPGERGTPRKYYSMTESGRAHLKARVAEWARVAGILDRMLFAKGGRQ